MKIINDKHLDLEVYKNRIRRDEKFPTIEKQQQHNLKHLQSVAQELIDRLITQKMIDALPSSIRAVAGFTREYSERVVPEQKYQLIGGFILLRLLNPALVSPDMYGIVPEGTVISQHARLNLVSLSKLLQKMSNEKLFLPNDDCSFLNEFMVINRTKLRKWMDEISIDPTAADKKESWKSFRYQKARFALRNYSLIDLKHLALLHDILFRNTEQIFKILRKNPMRENSVGVKERLDIELMKVLAGLGVPTIRCVADRVEEVTETRKARDESVVLPSITKPAWLLPIYLNHLAQSAPIRYSTGNTSTSIAPRFGQCTVKYQDKVFFWGGCSENGRVLTPPPLQYLCLSTMTLHSASQRGSPPPAGYFASGAVYNNFFYVFGGIGSQDKYFNHFYRYDIDSGQWLLIHAAAQTSSRMPAPRYGHTAVFLDEDMFIFGGYAFDGNKGSHSNEMWRFSPSTGLWEKISTIQTPVHRTEHSAIAYRGKMYIFGGRSAKNDALNDLHEYNPNTNQWTVLKPATDYIHPQQTLIGSESDTQHTVTSVPGRYGHSAVLREIDGSMVVFGGFSGREVFSDVITFHFDSNTFTLYDPPGTAEPSSFHDAIYHNRTMYVLFGRRKDFTVNLQLQQLDFGALAECSLRAVSARNLESLSLSFKTIINQRTLSDVIFTVGLRNFYAHKIVLMARAPDLYENLLQSGPGMATTKQIKLNTSEISELGFEAIVHCLYCGEVPTATLLSLSGANDQLVKLFQFARRYKLSSVMDICECFLCSALSLKNVIGMFNLSSCCNLRLLKNRCVRILTKQISQFVHTAEFSEIPIDSEIYQFVSDIIIYPFGKPSNGVSSLPSSSSSSSMT
eukprot:CAMPEP_0201556066 /NCGR_PEP_ID=MMETSP0173_2-20130828/52970_1 /ASSEMBLY_ACC=CAM_ASM_000268 /TAXON_ID=218659 /ORGANISM="Vexillifera sp., Strain DIVA3 564/2" /LENGTH=849 /DNA_ID=CAMNT_0047968137 /DNA_START=273 /DNA_END=2822 /DNA_ORIENTATION=-